MTTSAQRRAALAALVEGEGVTRVTPPLLLPAGPYFDLAGEEFGRRLLLTSGGDGTEFCLRPDFTLPIVAVTGEADAKRLLDIGFSQVLQKPFTKARLLEALQRWVPGGTWK